MNPHFAARRTCIFAGAGFSKALAGVPSQLDLIARLLEWDRHQMSRPHLSKSMRQLMGALRDIELVLSHYHYLAYQVHPRPPGGHRYELMLLRVALASFLDEKSRDFARPDLKTVADLLAGFLERKALKITDVFVVTTNYDFVMERLLREIFGADSYWYPGISRRHKEEAIPIYKLHGSVNWMENRGPISQKETTRPPAQIEILEPSEMHLAPTPRKSTGYIFAKELQKYTPILVPFMFQKTAWLVQNNERWKRLFDCIWDEARQRLLHSRQLMVWGYGLPAADYHLFSMLHTVLAKSRLHCEIVDCSGDTTMIRLGRLFGERTRVLRTDLMRHLLES